MSTYSVLRYSRVLLTQKMTKITQRASRRGIYYVCSEKEGTELQQYQCWTQSTCVMSNTHQSTAEQTGQYNSRQDGCTHTLHVEEYNIN